MRNLRDLLGWLDAPLRLRWMLLLPVAAIAALVEALGALAIFGLLRLIVEPARVHTTPVVAELAARLPTQTSTGVLGVLIVLVAGFYLARGAILIAADWLRESTVSRSGAKAAERLLARYLAADYQFHLRRRSASPIQEVARSTGAAYQLVVASLVNIFAELVTVAALVTAVAWAAPAAVLGIALLVVVVACGPFLITRHAWQRAGQDTKRLEEQELHVLQQSLGAIAEVKVAGREAFFERRARAVRRQLAEVAARRATMGASMRVGVETVLILAMLLIIWAVVGSGATAADTVSVLALAAYAGFRVMPAANRIMLNAGYLREGQAYVATALADWRALPREPTRSPSRDTDVSFVRALVFDGVSFTYDNSDLPAIRNVHLRVAAGESLGIVGATGAGKSTLVGLLLGLLPPTSGRITVDDEPLEGRERAWQRQIGYVPQEPFLLDDTLRRNIAFGVPDTQIDEQRLVRAIERARLREVIQTLPQDLDTSLGEHGSRLSGGQRQRVAIARALYAEPAVIVLDEATAALDYQTERDVTESIAALRGQRTLIVIAHRLSTVRGCDRLVFLQDGRVAATGTYDELRGNAAFRAMAALE